MTDTLIRPNDDARDDAGLADALVRLLDRDLTDPLGPLQVAVSAIRNDPTAGRDVRAFARLAGAQARRTGRIVDAVLAALRGPRTPVLRPSSLRLVALRAAASLEALGGSATVIGADHAIEMDAGQIHDAVLGLMECAAGPEGAVLVAIHGEESDRTGVVHIRLEGTDRSGCQAGLSAAAPQDWRSALALGAAEVIRGHGGSVAASERGLVITMPVEASREPGRSGTPRFGGFVGPWTE